MTRYARIFRASCHALRAALFASVPLKQCTRLAPAQRSRP